MSKRLTVTQRWEQGVPHDPRSKYLYKSISDIDFKEGSDFFCFKSGGDGDNGEHLMYLLDIHFDKMDHLLKGKKTHGAAGEHQEAEAKTKRTAPHRNRRSEDAPERTDST